MTIGQLRDWLLDFNNDVKFCERKAFKEIIRKLDVHREIKQLHLLKMPVTFFFYKSAFQRKSKA